MHQQFAAIALCMFAQGAAAQCVAASATPTSHPAAAVSEQPVRTGAATAQAPHAPRAELIKTAAASTRDDGPPAVREAARSSNEGQDHPRRGGTAMLLAALALMSGIALRRFGAPDA